MRNRHVKHGTHIIHEFNLARTNSEVVKNGTRLTAATVSASRRRGPVSPAARISIYTEWKKEVCQWERPSYHKKTEGVIPLLEGCTAGILRATYANASFQRDRITLETEAH